MRFVNKIPRWLPSILCVAAILWLTLASDPTPDISMPLIPGLDKICHGIMFGGLTLCLCFDTSHQNDWRPLKLSTVLLLAGASALFGVGIEYLQDWMGQGRSFEVADMLADTIGSFIFGIIAYLFRSRGTLGHI